MKVKFLDLVEQYRLLKPEIDEAVQAVFEKAQFIKGEEVHKFEKEFSCYCDCDHCIACGNGTDALTYLIKAMDLRKGSTVIVPANTFIATAEAVIANGLNVKFADINDDYTISPESVESLIDEEASAIVAVHLYGLPAKMNELKKIADRHNIKLIEDAAQAHGAEIEGERVGSLSDGAIFSFYPGKVLGAAGDAGAVTTNSSEIAERVRMFCDHGRSEKYYHSFSGGNSRMDTVQAAVLNVKLKYLEEWIEKRNKLADKYLKLLKDVENIQLPVVGNGIRHSWHLFVVRVRERDRFINHLEKNGIQCGIHYPLSLPQQPAFYDHLKYSRNYKALSWSEEYVSLPIGEHMTDEMIHYVVSEIKKFL